MAKLGRDSKFNDSLKPIIKMLYRKGATDKDVATALCVDEGTIYNWQKAHASFFKSVKDWKLEADEKVVRSLLERATGYVGRDEKVFYDKDSGAVITHETEKHYPPDPTSMIFWLKNRRPQEWREKVDHAHTQDEPTKIEITYKSEAPKRIEADFSIIDDDDS